MGRFTALTGCVLSIVASRALAQPSVGELREMRAAVVSLRGSDGWERVLAVQSLDQQGLALVKGDYSEIGVAEAYRILGEEQEYIGAILEASRLEMEPLPEIPPQDPCAEDPGSYEHLSAFRTVARHASYDASRCWIWGDYEGAMNRVAAIVRTGNALIGTGHALDSMTGGAIRGLAAEKLAAMAEECEQEPRLVRALSPDALAELRSAIESRPAVDPEGGRAWTVGDMRRRVVWLRAQFMGECGAERLRAYLQRNGKTQEELQRVGALGMALASEEGFRLLIEPDPEERRRGVLAFWESLTEKERAEAIARYEEWTRDSRFSPLDMTPRFFPDVVQNLSDEEIAKTLDEIERLASRLEAAESREDVAEAFTVLWLAAERDRTQLTRIASMPGASGVQWRSSLERFDEAVGAVERLGRFVRDDD